MTVNLIVVFSKENVSLIRGVRTVFLNKTGNHFVKTNYLLVIRLCDVMCHMAACHLKAAGEVKRSYMVT